MLLGAESIAFAAQNDSFCHPKELLLELNHFLAAIQRKKNPLHSLLSTADLFCFL